MTELAKIEDAGAVAVHAPTQQDSGANAIISMIERVAINPDVDIEKMERLMEMRRQEEDRFAEREFNAAFAAMQAELPIIPERGSIKNNRGAVQSTYPLWEDVIAGIGPVLARHGFGIGFDRASVSEKAAITGILSHAGGHNRTASITLPADNSGSKNAVQAEGSTVSYGQRYTSKMLVNWRSEGSNDDDGSNAGRSAGDTISPDQYIQLRDLIGSTGGDEAKFCAFQKINSLHDLPAKHFDAAKRLVEETAAKRADQGAAE